MDSSGRSSPVKRSVSFQHPPSSQRSSSATRRQSPHSSGVSEQPQKPTVHKPQRQHVVGAHRAHGGRNLSHKSLNKLQRLALTHNLAADGNGGGGEGPTSNTQAPTTAAHKHLRKKSAPVSPSTSPHAGPQARRNGSHAALVGQASNAPVKRNVSTPILKRNTSTNFVKKGHPPNKPVGGEKREPKKAVGFQLADSDDEDDDEWEDHSSQSNSSTRRNSLAPTGKMNGEKEGQHHSSALTNSPLVQDDKTAEPFKTSGEPQISTMKHAQAKHNGQDDMTSSFLRQPYTSKASPTISPISATARRATSDCAPHEDASLVNLSSSLTAVNNLTSQTAVNPHGTSSSAEGGVSRFLPNDQRHVGAQSASNPSAPSSFLPHYHPDTPPSPDVPSRRPQSPTTTSRRRPAEPASRTQQKLWLQRTATLSTSPPGGPMDGLRATMDTAPVNHDYGHFRTGSGTFGHENGRGVMGAPGLPGRQGMEDSEAKRTRKAYDRFAAELSVVQRFRSPTTDSFNRLVKIFGPDSREIPSRGRGDQRQTQTNGHAPSSATLSRPNSRAFSKSRDFAPGASKQGSTTHSKGSQIRFQDQVNSGDTSHHTEDLDVDHSQLLPDGHGDEQIPDSADPRGSGAYTNGLGTSYRRYHPNDQEMLLRRMWESMEVPVGGD